MPKKRCGCFFLGGLMGMNGVNGADGVNGGDNQQDEDRQRPKIENFSFLAIWAADKTRSNWCNTDGHRDESHAPLL